MPPNLDLYVILDNSSKHKTAEVKRWLEANPRFKLHFTPTSASWLNAVESWFGQLEHRSIHRGVFTSVKDLRDEIHRFIKQHNPRSAHPYKWKKSAEVILEKMERAKQSLNGETNQSGH
jgi:transposase